MEIAMNQSPKETTDIPTPAATGRIAFVRAGWHEDLLEHAWRAFYDTMTAAGWPAQAIDLSPVPGAFEIPPRCRLLDASGSHRAVVGSDTAGHGGLYPHDVVAAALLNALYTWQPETQVTVLVAALQQ